MPAFHSEDEEARWYGAHRHDLHEYVNMDDAEVVEPQPTADHSGMTEAIFIRLPRRLLTGLRRVAEQQEVSYQTLVKRWLTERLAQEAAAADSRPSPARRSRAA
jgi:predicted DNA binding CopG/RHH family protein